MVGLIIKKYEVSIEKVTESKENNDINVSGLYKNDINVSAIYKNDINISAIYKNEINISGIIK